MLGPGTSETCSPQTNTGTRKCGTHMLQPTHRHTHMQGRHDLTQAIVAAHIVEADSEGDVVPLAGGELEGSPHEADTRAPITHCGRGLGAKRGELVAAYVQQAARPAQHRQAPSATSARMDAGREAGGWSGLRTAGQQIAGPGLLALLTTAMRPASPTPPSPQSPCM